MKYIYNLLILLTLLASTSSFALNLRPGDVILIELRCYSCSIIADETNSRFSHSGVVIGKQGNQIQVAQAFGPVHMTSLENFLNQRVKGTSALVLRSDELKASAKELSLEFNQSWKGIPFDPNYTWDNEKLYCSEFVAKFLEVFLGPVLPPKPLDFSRNWDYWSRVMYPVPQGKPGNSPGDLERSPIFFHVGEID
ncbi:MAG: hypothetical protein COW01_08695 [Bdellovibrionales bacterium CG12_big_fil_rev_8_21_14_0_65_38_15]|nr:hypothetical protein [Candidatus Paceibacterota bacterium]PIP91608.1 MAG: hypothetical protein COW79_01680 [Bdellovibrionales bacterium CG22_combo_CG10-13_8_21_14_all_38_13]PIQ55080.1 MAG: hypothetical protein COW01_08695 [Bdellovibrionales bacterium CG12_big_fil_rev_8_21_14_0_65_38_15]PIR30561.1 MAG: hypothetical protein COV38_05270 [Bdellovibrionales bacterium CG11_big_fil_rev_8_21_14_0_20_38_13]